MAELLGYIWPWILFVVLVILAYYLGKWRERYSKIKQHDHTIFKLIDAVLNESQLKQIVLKAEHGLLPPGTFAISDYFDKFITMPTQRFINKQLNRKFKKLVDQLHEIGQLYSTAKDGGYIDANDSNSEYKLFLNEEGDQQSHDQLLKSSLKLAAQLDASYMDFRILIKKRLII